ncbi:MAG: hypothetical protein NZT92_10835 [Abditibacteriales bacterium]|nr:hypothetical protein [Abditibacteriales bacterium]MDW8366393.1 hypothetical protein [Abditibacteriales bacterium]
MKLRIGLWMAACVTMGAVVFGQMMGGQLSPAVLDKYQNSLREDTTLAQDDARKLEEQSAKMTELLKKSPKPPMAAIRPQVESFNNSLTEFNISSIAVNLNVNALRFDMELSIRKDQEEARRKDIMAGFRLSAEEIDALLKRGLTYSEIVIANNLILLLSRSGGAAGASTERVYALRESGKGWGEIFRTLGVKQPHLNALGDLLVIPKPPTASAAAQSNGENGGERR